MATIFSNVRIPDNRLKENKIAQGDIIHCNANGTGAISFWAIYGHGCGVVSLDGGGNQYLPNEDLYLFETYSHWTIDYRIPNHRLKMIIEEVF